MVYRPWLGWTILLVFVALFTLEAWLFLEVGKRIGFFPTIAWIFASFILGLVLMRVEGLRMLFRIHRQLQRGVVPAAEMLNGLAVVVSGMLLMLPGYFTDTLGLLLLFPPTRALLLIAFARPLVRWAGINSEEEENGMRRPSEEVIEIEAEPVGKDSQPA